MDPGENAGICKQKHLGLINSKNKMLWAHNTRRRI